jgi:hypothetical protein
MSDWVAEMMAFEKTLRPDGPEQRCDRCQFWQPHLVIMGRGDNDDLRGECHRHAPSPLQAVISKIGRVVGAAAWACEETANVKHDKDGKDFGTDYTFEGQDQAYVHEWPMTSDDDWCGDFSRLTPEKLALRDVRSKELAAMADKLTESR